MNPPEIRIYLDRNILVDFISLKLLFFMIIYCNSSEKINFQANAKTFLSLYLHIACVKYIAHKSFMMHKNKMTNRIDRNVKLTLVQK